MRVSIEPEEFTAAPGAVVTVRVSVANDRDVIEGYVADVLGTAVTVVSVAPAELPLFPGRAGAVTLVLRIPPGQPAGRQVLQVRVRSQLDGRSETKPFALVVADAPKATLRLDPQVVTARKQADLSVIITNTGNVDLDLLVQGGDPERVLTVTSSPPMLHAPAGQQATARVSAKGKRPFFGSPVVHPLKVEALCEGVALSGQATVIQKPRIPRAALALLALLAAVALWAVVLLSGVKTVVNQADQGRADAAAAAAAQEAALAKANKVGSIIGHVVTQATAAPVPGATVELFQGSTKVSSAASDERGLFTLPNLLPGGYQVRGSADGFVQLWFPASTIAPGASTIQVVGGGSQTIAFALPGLPGSIKGQVVAAGGSGGVTVNVAISSLTGTPPAIPSVVTDAAGSFQLDNLPTPATYSLTFVKAGFSDGAIQVPLAPGENPKQIDPVTMLGAPGQISGVVRGATSAGTVDLAGVLVTVSDGKTTVTSATPTVGASRTYLVSGLPTPGTYSVTFALQGFVPTTISVTLGPGQKADGLVTTLAGVSNAISGIVVDTGGHPLGGVTVTATNGSATSTATSLTTAGSVGSFTVSGLPTPSTFIVTFTLAGYQTTSLQVTLGSGGPGTGLTATMAPLTATISGTVRDAGGPVAGATVELTNGTFTATVISVSAPAAKLGAYAFSGLTPGTYSLRVSDQPNHGSFTIQVSVAQGETKVQDLLLPAPGSIGGTVAACSGSGPAGVTVTVTSNGAAFGPPVTTNAAGFYVVPNLPLNRPYQVTFVYPDGHRASVVVALTTTLPSATVNWPPVPTGAC